MKFPKFLRPIRVVDPRCPHCYKLPTEPGCPRFDRNGARMHAEIDRKLIPWEYRAGWADTPTQARALLAKHAMLDRTTPGSARDTMRGDRRIITHCSCGRAFIGTDIHIADLLWQTHRDQAIRHGGLINES